jgi:hypothetical protein
MGWREKFEELICKDKIKTDSHIEDFAEEYKVSIKEVYEYLDDLSAKGTSCEGCKHHSMWPNMYPCNCCSRCYVKDYYEAK